MDEKEASQTIGATLTAFLKSGPDSTNHIDNIKSQILDIVLAHIPTPTEVTKNYERVSRDFLNKVIKVKGVPTTSISESGKGGALVSSSGKHIAQNFEKLRPKIIGRYEWCVENYRKQSQHVFGYLMGEFTSLLEGFLRRVPPGGTKDKEVKSQITEIKREFRDLTKWHDYLFTSKISSLTSEIEHIFAVENGALALEWSWSPHSCDVQEHEARNGNVYLLRENEQQNSSLKARNGYYDQITAVNEEIGCMCSACYIFKVSSLPSDMFVSKEFEEKTCATSGNPSDVLKAKAPSGNAGFMEKLSGWFLRGNSGDKK